MAQANVETRSLPQNGRRTKQRMFEFKKDIPLSWSIALGTTVLVIFFGFWEFATFQGWMTEKKIYEGHSEDDAVHLPTQERLEEMGIWVELGRPAEFRHS